MRLQSSLSILGFVLCSSLAVVGCSLRTVSSLGTDGPTVDENPSEEVPTPTGILGTAGSSSTSTSGAGETGSLPTPTTVVSGVAGSPPTAATPIPATGGRGSITPATATSTGATSGTKTTTPIGDPVLTFPGTTLHFVPQATISGSGLRGIQLTTQEGVREAGAPDAGAPVVQAHQFAAGTRNSDNTWSEPMLTVTHGCGGPVTHAFRIDATNPDNDIFFGITSSRGNSLSASFRDSSGQERDLTGTLTIEFTPATGLESLLMDTSDPESAMYARGSFSLDTIPSTDGTPTAPLHLEGTFELGVSITYLLC